MPTIVVEPNVMQQVVPGAWVFFLSQDDHYAFQVRATRLVNVPVPAPTDVSACAGAYACGLTRASPYCVR